jgi:hypothetical protein
MCKHTAASKGGKRRIKLTWLLLAREIQSSVTAAQYSTQALGC